MFLLDVCLNFLLSIQAIADRIAEAAYMRSKEESLETKTPYMRKYKKRYGKKREVSLFLSCIVIWTLICE